MKKVQIEIMNHKMEIACDDVAGVQKLAEKVNQKIAEIQQQQPNTASKNILYTTLLVFQDEMENIQLEEKQVRKLYKEYQIQCELNVVLKKEIESLASKLELLATQLKKK